MVFELLQGWGLHHCPETGTTHGDGQRNHSPSGHPPTFPHPTILGRKVGSDVLSWVQRAQAESRGCGATVVVLMAVTDN